MKDIYFQNRMRLFSIAACLWLGGEFLTGCGDSAQNGNLVRDVKVELQTVNQDLYAVLTANIDTGSVQMPSVTMPIFDPNHFSTHYGQVAMKPALGGGTELNIAVDLTTTANLGAGSPTLPNGSPLPVGGISNVPVITLPLEGSQGAELYLTLTQSVGMIGVAIPIKEFQQLGNSIGGINFFPSFQMPDGLKGIAGIFTGTSATGSGIALFFDFSSVLPKPTQNLGARMMSFAATAAEPTLTYRDVIPDDDSKNAISRTMYKLNRKRAKLHIQ